MVYFPVTSPLFYSEFKIKERVLWTRSFGVISFSKISLTIKMQTLLVIAVDENSRHLGNIRYSSLRIDILP